MLFVLHAEWEGIVNVLLLLLLFALLLCVCECVSVCHDQSWLIEY